MMENHSPTPAVRMAVAASGDAGQRIDNYLLRELKGVPRSLIYRILRSGEVRVNKGRVQASHRLQAGDQIRIPPVRTAERPEAAAPSAGLLQRLEESILYEDRRLMVINKPSGIAVHGGSGVSHGVIEALRALRPQEKELELVHRLDRETSGLLLIARRRSGLRQLHDMIRLDQMEKRYLALVAGNWEGDRRTVDAPLLKNQLQGGERIVRVDPEGKASRTRFRALERFDGCMLVEAVLDTGRTHQIRVHLAHLGTPVLGDDKYGDEAANKRFRQEVGLRRLFLHAATLRFDWPEPGKRFQVEAPLETALEEVLARLRNSR